MIRYAVLSNVPLSYSSFIVHPPSTAIALFNPLDDCPCVLPLQIVQDFYLGMYDPEATAVFNQTVSDASTTDASQRYNLRFYITFIGKASISVEFIMVLLQVSLSCIHQWDHL